jgi:hypothetical protein
VARATVAITTTMKIPAPFKTFVASTERHFGFLVGDYGFLLKGVDVAAYEAWVTFENETTRVTVTYEMGSPPWVEIARLEHRDDKRIARDEISLDFVLEEHGKKDAESPVGYGDIPDEIVDEMLRAKAKSLREDAADLLRGDFEALPLLRKRAEENLRRRNVELFGSETGETPR